MEILQQSILYRRCFKWLNPCLFLILFLVAVTSRTLGTEIEDKSLRIYLNKVGDRKKSI